MNRIAQILILCLAVHWAPKTQAQTISDCAGAINLCESFYFEEQAPLNTGDVGEYTGGCNQSIEWNSVWYTFTVQSDGNLSFVLTPNDLNDDYDWGLFDITEGGCDGINAQDGTSPEVSCNSWGTLNPPNGATGISTSLGGVSNSAGPGDQFGPPFNSDLPVQTGHTFALVVMNWSGSSNGYSIDFGESTAALFDAIPPSLTEAVMDCSNATLTISFSENVVVSTAQNLDFVIEGPSEPLLASVQPVDPNPLGSLFELNFATPILTPGNYQLIISDASGLIEDPCGNTAPDTIVFVVNTPIGITYQTGPACNGVNGAFTLSGITNGTAPYQAELGPVALTIGEEYNITAGNYTLNVVDDAGCSTSVSITIPNETLSASIVFADTLTCLNPSGHFEINVVSSEPDLIYQWSTTEGQLADAGTDDPTYFAPGLYTLQVSTVPNDCSVQANYVVVSEEVYEIDESLIVFPNIVSPNQDNKNDYWSPRLITAPDFDMASLFKTYDLHIFDRWGNQVFSNMTGGPWYPDNGAQGVYFYTLVYSIVCGDGAEKKLEGTIQIVE